MIEVTGVHGALELDRPTAAMRPAHFLGRRV
jgi:hypothetical protein